jgi:hypothetical protein
MALDFGIEIECLFPANVTGLTQTMIKQRVARGVAVDLTDAGVPTEFQGYNHRLTATWKIVTDMSLSAPTGYVGLEIVSPPLNEENGIPAIRKVCETLARLGAKTNRSCGFHVHIGARGLTVETLKRLAFLYIEHEDVVDSLLPPSRRAGNNQYCASLKGADAQQLERATTVQQIAAAIKSDSSDNPSRYVKLNFCSFWRHGTVEFRQHSGTIDAEKIIRWIYLCQKMVDISGVENAPGSPISAEVNAAIARRLQRARKSAIIYGLACRSEGVTALEMQELLGTRTLASPSIPLTRLGVAFRTAGRRNGHIVYKVTAGQPVPTLVSLLAKLGLSEEDNAFWHNRRALLGTADVPTDLAE